MQHSILRSDFDNTFFSGTPPSLLLLAERLDALLLPLPFYAMELLVGLVQALVFMLLTAVFTLLICTHEEGHGEGHGHASEHH